MLICHKIWDRTGLSSYKVTFEKGPKIITEAFLFMQREHLLVHIIHNTRHWTRDTFLLECARRTRKEFREKEVPLYRHLRIRNQGPYKLINIRIEFHVPSRELSKIKCAYCYSFGSFCLAQLNFDCGKKCLFKVNWNSLIGSKLSIYWIQSSLFFLFRSKNKVELVLINWIAFFFDFSFSPKVETLKFLFRRDDLLD